MVMKNVKKSAKNDQSVENAEQIDQKVPKKYKNEEKTAKNGLVEASQELVVPRTAVKIETYKNEMIKMTGTSNGAKLTKARVYRKGFEKEKNELIDVLERNEYLTMNTMLNGQNLRLDEKNWDLRTTDSGLQFEIEPVENVHISKSLEMDENKYTGKLTIRITNRTNNAIEVKGTKINWGPVKNSGKSRFNIMQAVILNNNKIERIKSKKKNEVLVLPISQGWAGIRDQYFCALFYGKPELFKSAEVIKKDDQTLQLVLDMPAKVIQPQSEGSFEINVYLGPQNYKELKKLGYDIHKIVNFGVFSFLSVPIYYLLKFLYNATKNYGVAIILLTIIIRALLWWPTQKSYTSMKKMQSSMSKMQPRLKTLKEVYRDNPQMLNQETMKLYKEYQINPMGGCLPMLLQMPVFFALYTTLTAAVELKGAAFIWVWKDLSLKDPVYVLPFVMGATMFLQQKMSTPPAATPESAVQQKMMLYMMPIMLTFFAFMWPSGLLLYWVVSNILSIGQQFMINRRS